MTSQERKQKVSELKAHWDSVFQALGLENPYYYPKPVIQKTGEDPFVYMFPTEISAKEDIYMEIVDFSLNTSGTRKLFRYRYNPHYESEYELGPTKIGDQYKVPFAEIEEVKVATPKVSLATKEDVSSDQLTGRDWACIHLRVPESNKSWLNELITKSK